MGIKKWLSFMVSTPSGVGVHGVRNGNCFFPSYNYDPPKSQSYEERKTHESTIRIHTRLENVKRSCPLRWIAQWGEY